MNTVILYMPSPSGRIIRGVIGLAALALGYALPALPVNFWMMGAGTLVALLAWFNISLLAPLAGVPVDGNKITRLHGKLEGNPTKHVTDTLPPHQKMRYNTNDNEGDGRAIYHTGSTTQGGSNYGQGSSQLDSGAYKQGDTRRAGSNYQDETSIPNKIRNNNPDEQPSAGK